MVGKKHTADTGQGITRRDTLKVLGGTAAGLTGILQARQAPAQAKPVTLRYWTWQNSADTQSPRSQAQSQFLALFRKKNPDIELIEEVVPWQQLFQQLLQASAANRAPDVSKVLDWYIAPLAEAGAILPLDEFTQGWSAERRNDYVYSWDDTTVGGKKYAFRHSIRPTNLMYYRTDLFAEAGFKTPPKTLKDFTAAAKASTKGQVWGFVEPFSKADQLNKFMAVVPAMYWVFGSDLVDLKTGKATFHLEAGQKIFQWHQDMVHVHKACPAGEATLDSDTVNNMFISGTVAATFDHSSKWPEWIRREALQGRLDTAGMPNFADQEKPTPANTANSWTLVMPKGAKKEAAWKLIEFLQSNESEIIDASVGGELPTRKSTLKDPFFQTPAAGKMLSFLNYLMESPHPATSTKIKKLEVLKDVLADGAQQIIGNKADVKSTLAVAAQKYDAQIG
jgi:ABC-type glycerol-3-phosphate transport system substrate-binding protein